MDWAVVRDLVRAAREQKNPYLLYAAVGAGGGDGFATKEEREAAVELFKWMASVERAARESVGWRERVDAEAQSFAERHGLA